MRIVILGAGQVGRTVAENLAHEANNDITVVDLDEHLLVDLKDRLDIATVRGYAAHPQVLERAGIEDADMLIAVTNSDEVNMVACQIAYTLHNTPTRIARVRAAEYLNYHKNLFLREHIPISYPISPEKLVTDYISQIIRHPGALQVMDFAEGRVGLVSIKAYSDGPLVGHALRELTDHLPGIHARVGAIYRHGMPLIPQGKTAIHEGDEVFFVAAKRQIRAVMKELRKLDRDVRRLIIAGGGNIGTRLAAVLEESHQGRIQVKIIERDVAVARRISEKLSRTIVLSGDAADENLLLEENIEHTDVFCAVTNDDEANILSAMLAKRLGATKVMALINRTAYVDLVEASGAIDVAISPQQATIGALLSHVRQGDVLRVHSLRRGAAEAIEAIAHGTPTTSRVVGRCIDEIELPPGATIVALVRGDDVLMAHRDTTIATDDHVILFLTDKRHVAQVTRLFAVDILF